MSQENVDLVRRVYEAHGRGDFTAVFAAYDPEIEWHVLRVAELGFDPVYVGHDGVRVVQSQRMRARTSGIEVEWNSYTQVWTIQDAKVVRMEFFPTRDEALEAVGLRE